MRPEPTVLPVQLVVADCKAEPDRQAIPEIPDRPEQQDRLALPAVPARRVFPDLSGLPDLVEYPERLE